MDLDYITKLIDRLAGSAAQHVRMKTAELDVQVTFAEPRSYDAALAVDNGAPDKVTSPSDEAMAYVSSPVPGSVYLAATPGAPPFVTVGQEICVGDTLALVEAMKSMLAVEAQEAGIVEEVLITDEQLVAPGDRLIRIRVTPS